MITADNITDEQIRDALDRRIIDAALAVSTGARLRGGYAVVSDDERRAARARCAEILEARRKEGK